MLPPIVYPPNFAAREALAVSKTKALVKTWFVAEKVAASHTGNDHDSDDSDQESDGSWVFSGGPTSVPPRPYLAFVDALPHFVVLNLGFHIDEQSQKCWCYCPCSKKGDNWRKRFNLQNLDDADVCSSTKKFYPK
jgi:hypothetical protein